jgi:LacI family transcriptional regulator
MLRKSHILGLVLPDLHGEFYSEILRGANFKARELGYQLMISSITAEDEGWAVMAAMGGHGMVDGVAVMISEADAATRQTLSSVDVPLVVLDGSVEGVAHDSIVIDQRKGASAMIRHLLDADKATRVIFVGGHETNLDTRERLEACRDVLAAAGHTMDAKDVYHLDYSYEKAYQLAKGKVRLWARSRSSVFAANDEMAAGVIDAAIENGLDLPKDLPVVGFDDTRIAQMTRPRLTTVRVPMSAMGAGAVELLCQRLDQPSRPHSTVTLQSELVVRESCGTEI